jgi:hypothetical protein
MHRLRTLNLASSYTWNSTAEISSSSSPRTPTSPTSTAVGTSTRSHGLFLENDDTYPRQRCAAWAKVCPMLTEIVFPEGETWNLVVRRSPRLGRRTRESTASTASLPLLEDITEEWCRQEVEDDNASTSTQVNNDDDGGARHFALDLHRKKSKVH